MSATFFETPAAFHAWLVAHHESEEELWVGYYKKGTGLLSMTWPESVDEALCFGWIDGLRKRIDDKAYMIRFTPRRKTSVWSTVNINKVEAMLKTGLMQPAGIAAYERRKERRSEVYSYEQKAQHLPSEYEERVKANPAAWDYFSNQLANWARKASIHWVLSAKQEATRERRLGVLIECSAGGEKIPMLRSKKK